MEDTNNSSVFNNLWERRVPQFFVTYATICFGIIQFLLFACNRYDSLPDNLIDKFLVFAVLLTPAVLLYIYNHGKPGGDPLTKREKILIPSNFAVAGLVAFFVGGSNPSIAAPTVVEITNEEGEQITRYVPATSQTRQLALFPFEANEENENWTEKGIPYLMSRDLEQDMRFYTKGLGSLEYHIKSFGYEVDSKIPFSTKLKIANKTKVDYFVTGDNLKKENEVWSVDLKIFETGSGELFQEQNYSDENLFNLVDKITIGISSSMFLKESNSESEKIVDLPASDLITNNLEALKMYCAGIDARNYKNEFQQAAQLFYKASELDPKSAELKKFLSFSLASLGDRDNSIKNIGDALTLSKQLPERQQLEIKKAYWQINDKLDNTLVLMNNWIKLYPQDYDPHKDLIYFYRTTMQLEDAKEIALLAVENGHKTRVLGELIDLSILNEDFEDAEKYLKEYYEAYPELAKEDVRMADLYIKKGEFDKAVDFYDAKLLDDPQNGKIYMSLADAHVLTGNQIEAENNFKKAIKLSDQASDSTTVFFKLMMFHMNRGETSKFNEVFDQSMEHSKTYMPGPSVAITAITSLGFATVAGSEDYVLDYVDKLTANLPQMSSIFDCYTNFFFHLYKENLEEFSKYYQGDCKKQIFQGNPYLKDYVNGFVNAQKGNHKEAIADYEKYGKSLGAVGKEFNYVIAKEYRLMDQPKETIKICEDYLATSPYNSNFLYELLQSQIAIGSDSSKDTYSKLKHIWSDAEPTFVYYDDFKEIGNKLGMSD